MRCWSEHRIMASSRRANLLILLLCTAHGLGWLGPAMVSAALAAADAQPAALATSGRQLASSFRLVAAKQVCTGVEYVQLGSLGWQGNGSVSECFAIAARADMSRARTVGAAPCPFVSWAPPVRDKEGDWVLECRCFLSCEEMEASQALDTYSWGAAAAEEEGPQGAVGQSTFLSGPGGSREQENGGAEKTAATASSSSAPNAPAKGGAGTDAAAASGGVAGVVAAVLPRSPGKAAEQPLAAALAAAKAAEEASSSAFPPGRGQGPAKGRCSSGTSISKRHLNLAWSGMSKERCFARAAASHRGGGTCPFLSYSSAKQAQERLDFCQCHQFCDQRAALVDADDDEAADDFWETFAAPYDFVLLAAQSQVEISAAAGEAKPGKGLAGGPPGLLSVLLAGILARAAVELLPQPLVNL